MRARTVFPNDPHHCARVDRLTHGPFTGVAQGCPAARTLLSTSAIAAALWLGASAAAAGTCTETVPGSGIFTCSGPASPTGLDPRVFPSGTATRTFQTVAGFGLDSRNTGPASCFVWECGAIRADGTTGRTISFIDRNASVIRGRFGGFSSISGGGDAYVETNGVLEGRSIGLAFNGTRNLTLRVLGGAIRATDATTSSFGISIFSPTGNIDALIAETVEIGNGIDVRGAHQNSLWDIAGRVTVLHPDKSALSLVTGGAAASSFVLRHRSTAFAEGSFGYFLTGRGSTDIQVEAGGIVRGTSTNGAGGAGFIMISQDIAATHRIVNAGIITGTNKGFNLGGSNAGVFFQNSGQIGGGSIGVELRKDSTNAGATIEFVNTGSITAGGGTINNPYDATKLFSGSALAIVNSGGATVLDLGGDISGAFHGVMVAADGYGVTLDSNPSSPTFGQVIGQPTPVPSGAVTITSRGTIRGGSLGGAGDGIHIRSAENNPDRPAYAIQVLGGTIQGGLGGTGPYSASGAFVASGAAVSTARGGNGSLLVEAGATLDGSASGVAVTDGNGQADMTFRGAVAGDILAGGGADRVFVGATAVVDGDIDLGEGDDLLVLDLDAAGTSGLRGSATGGSGTNTLVYSLQSGSLVLQDETAGSAGLTGFSTIAKTGAGDLTLDFTPATDPATLFVLNETLRLQSDLSVTDTGTDPAISGRAVISTNMTGTDFARLVVGDGLSPTVVDLARGLVMQGHSRVEVATNALLRLGPEGLQGDGGEQSVAASGMIDGNISLGAGDDLLAIMAAGRVTGSLAGGEGSADALDWQLADGTFTGLAEGDVAGFETIRLRGLGSDGVSGFAVQPSGGTDLAPQSAAQTGLALDAGPGGTIDLLDGARLYGTGNVRGNLTVGAHSRIGRDTSQDLLAVEGSFTQGAGSFFDVDLRPVPGREAPVAGVTHDLLRVSGTASLDAGAGLVLASTASSQDWLAAMASRVAAGDGPELRYRILDAGARDGMWTTNVSMGVVMPEFGAVDLPDLTLAPGLAAGDAATTGGPLLTYLSYDATGADVVVRLLLPTAAPSLPGPADAGLISAGASLFTLPAGISGLCGASRLGGWVLCEQQRRAAAAQGPEAWKTGTMLFDGEVFGTIGTLSGAREEIDWSMGGVKLTFGGSPEFAGQDMFLGAMLTLGQGSVDLAVRDATRAGDTLDGDLESDSVAISAFGQWAVSDRLQIEALVGYGQHRVDQDRISDYTGVAETLSASYTASQWTADLTARANLIVNPDYRVNGVAGIGYGEFDRPAYTETGSAFAAYTVDSARYDSLRTTLGVEAERYWSPDGTALYGLQGRLAWVREHGDRAISSGADSALGGSFDAPSEAGSIQLARDALNVGIRFSAETAPNTAISVGLDATWAGEDQSSWRAGLSYEFRF